MEIRDVARFPMGCWEAPRRKREIAWWSVIKISDYYNIMFLLTDCNMKVKTQPLWPAYIRYHSLSTSSCYTWPGRSVSSSPPYSRHSETEPACELFRAFGPECPRGTEGNFTVYIWKEGERGGLLTPGQKSKKQGNKKRTKKRQKGVLTNII